MQSQFSDVLNWKTAVVGTLVATISSITTYFINRKKLPSEIHKTDADTSFRKAETSALELKTDITAFEMLREMNRYVIELERRDAHQKDQIEALEKQIIIFKADRTKRRLE